MSKDNRENNDRLSTKQINEIIQDSERYTKDERLQAFEDQQAKKDQSMLTRMGHRIKKSAVGKTVNSAGNYIGDQASRAGNYVSGQASRAGNYVSGQASRAGNYVSGQASRAGNYINDKVEDFNLAIDKKIAEHGAKKHANKLEKAGKKYRIDKLLGREDKAAKHYQQGRDELAKTTSYANAYRGIDARQHQKAEHRKAEYEQKLANVTKGNLFTRIANKFKHNKKVDQKSVDDQRIVVRNQNKDIGRY